MKTQFIPLENPTALASHLEISLYYDKGGMNYFNGGCDPRGYWLSVTPVKVEDQCIGRVIGHGSRRHVLTVTRKSNKAYREASALCTPEYVQELIDKVLGKQDEKAKLNAISKALGIGLPPRFEGMTQEQIENLPVKVVLDSGCHTYSNLAEAKKHHALNTLCGAMADGGFIRFESQAVYNMMNN